MAKLTHKRISGSTLIEVLIAMVIIMVIFSIAIGLYYNVLSNSLSHQKLQAMKQMELIIMDIKKKGSIWEDNLKIDSIEYNLSAKGSFHPEMDILEVKASINGQSLGSIRALYKRDESQ
ncbi:hypothetical protein EZ449_15360 [Pedobacter frigidisoli]|uniref:Prepilin-type N-terminal cleavage/methylation domain-containing protein n=1 Tax=Pedobacter frigidisoli TaxID=2530455 RepID=A0A4R0NVY1_9SPHI|nr:prepilin-type N-terminal cleavage/methylation domain-containing protein [Pedobacter frigidisoli]TCD05841.1 hypothetical protein EZ449_15360 [Pedobacter frigidisoli]